MKKLDEILTHIEDDPTFYKINTFLEIKKFVNILPLKLKSGIKFAYIKADTLVFALKHPTFKMEFQHSNNIADLKALLKMTKLRNINKFSFFVVNNIEKNKNEENKADSTYKERSYGIFENKLKDEVLFNSLENIRKIIKGS